MAAGMLISVAVAVVSFGTVDAAPLWPPSAQTDLEDFDGSWRILNGDFAAHSADGGRTVAKRGLGRVLHVSLPGTFTVPQQFSALLKFSVDEGFDTIGLDYGWGPSPDSKRSAQCATSGSCQACQDNYHELICFGSGTDLITGAYPVFGDDQAETLKFTHFYDAGVSFLPAFALGRDANLSAPLPSKTRAYISSIQGSYSVEVLLGKVLAELGWSDYLSAGMPDWSRIVVSGHSQGASHAGYIAYRRELRGVLLLSGPQDTCGEDGATWAYEASLLNKGGIFSCFALDEPGRPAILRNLAFMTEATQVNMTDRTMSHGAGEWCAPPAHCATGVDDQLADAAVERCFSKLRAFRPKVPLWPPQAQEDPAQMGRFDSSWRILGEGLAAHASEGGRTVAKRGQGRVLHVSLPGTFTVPQQFSALLKFSVAVGLDTIGLDYGWGPSPDSKRSAQCASLGADSCQACQDNYHELIGFGGGTDLIEGPHPVFGDGQSSTLKFTHFFSSGVSFLPAFELGADVNITSPLPSASRQYIRSIKQSYNVEALLVRVLGELGWSEYLSAGTPDWSRIVISGHSQGASHAAYIAYKRQVQGALLLSGPQDACGDDGASWAEEAAKLNKENIFGCYAMDEPGKPAIERNLAFMSEVLRVNMTGRSTSHGSRAWCAPPTHCATGVDDQLADAAVEQCFSKLLAFGQWFGESISVQVSEPLSQGPASEASGAWALQMHLACSLVFGALFFSFL